MAELGELVWSVRVGGGQQAERRLRDLDDQHEAVAERAQEADRAVDRFGSSAEDASREVSELDSRASGLIGTFSALGTAVTGAFGNIPDGDILPDVGDGSGGGPGGLVDDVAAGGAAGALARRFGTIDAGALLARGVSSLGLSPGTDAFFGSGGLLPEGLEEGGPQELRPSGPAERFAFENLPFVDPDEQGNVDVSGEAAARRRERIAEAVSDAINVEVGGGADGARTRDPGRGAMPGPRDRPGDAGIPDRIRELPGGASDPGVTTTGTGIITRSDPGGEPQIDVTINIDGEFDPTNVSRDDARRLAQLVGNELDREAGLRP